MVRISLVLKGWGIRSGVRVVWQCSVESGVAPSLANPTKTSLQSESVIEHDFGSGDFHSLGVLQHIQNFFSSNVFSLWSLRGSRGAKIASTGSTTTPITHLTGALSPTSDHFRNPWKVLIKSVLIAVIRKKIHSGVVLFVLNHDWD